MSGRGEQERGMPIDYTARFAGEWIDFGARGFSVHHPSCAGGAVGDGTTGV